METTNQTEMNAMIEKYKKFWEAHHCCECDEEVFDCKENCCGYWECGMCDTIICDSCCDWRDTTHSGRVCKECEKEVNEDDFDE